MTDHVSLAFEKRKAGYNCAQSVLCAFAEKTGLDEETLFKLSEGLGAGMGNMKNTCGALSAACMLAGIVYSGGTPDKNTKGTTYAAVSKIVDKFEEKCKSTVCREIKGNETGNMLVTCDECVKIAVETVDEMLFGD